MLKPGRGQPTAQIGAGIQADPPRILVRSGRWRMAVHHRDAQRAVVIEKVVTNPQQVVFGLPIEFDAGAYACVNKQVIAHPNAHLQRGQEA